MKWPCCSLCSTKAEGGVCWGGLWPVKVSPWQVRGARSVCCSSFRWMSSTEDRKQLIIITKLSKHPIPLIFSLKCDSQMKSRLSLQRSEIIPVGTGQVSLCPVAVPELVRVQHQGGIRVRSSGSLELRAAWALISEYLLLEYLCLSIGTNVNFEYAVYVHVDISLD